jgi:hypothetical protein
VFSLRHDGLRRALEIFAANPVRGNRWLHRVNRGFHVWVTQPMMGAKTKSSFEPTRFRWVVFVLLSFRCKSKQFE